MTNLSDEEFKKLEHSQSTEEWNSICDEVKKTRDGEYPPDWYEKVVVSGLAHKATMKFLKDNNAGC